MEMTIEKHIEVLSSYNHGFTGYAGNLQDSIDVAIDIMCKYQKISDIIKFADDNELGYEYMGEKIYEVFIYDR